MQAQKFEAIGQLAGGIAHDFNNMIGEIIGWADLGIEDTDPSSRIHRHFEKVRQQADRAAALTKQLLAFARRQILEPRTIDLNQVTVETLSLLENVIGSNVEIKASLAPDLAVVRADPVQIEQVLMDLCIGELRGALSGGHGHGKWIAPLSTGSSNRFSPRRNWVRDCVPDRHAAWRVHASSQGTGRRQHVSRILSGQH